MTDTVMIVDDHPGFRESARTLLEAEGFRVVAEAGDGAEALRLAAEHAPGIVILDVGLPDMLGFDVARHLAEGPAPPCVVLVSSRDASDFGGLVAESGACGFVPKWQLSGAAVLGLVEGRR